MQQQLQTTGSIHDKLEQDSGAGNRRKDIE